MLFRFDYGLISDRYHQAKMEFRQLVYFIAVAEELNFSRAAKRLHLSQPALSKQIQALENSLEIELFNRTKHWVKLTPAGKQFLTSDPAPPKGARERASLITARSTLQQL